MKNIIIKKKNNALFKVALSVSLWLVALSSCQTEKGGFPEFGGVINHSTTNVDTLQTVRLGQQIRIYGTGFEGLIRVYFNGQESYFNSTYSTSTSIIIRVPNNLKVTGLPDDIRNTITLETGATKRTFSFPILPPAPKILAISHTLPKAGDEIIITGVSLYNVKKITFPGGLEITSGITSTPEGDAVAVTVPNIGDHSGAILLETENEKVYSPSYFNYKQGVVYDFDNGKDAGEGGYTVVDSWGKLRGSAGQSNTRLNTSIPSTTERGVKSQGYYGVINNGFVEIPIDNGNDTYCSYGKSQDVQGTGTATPPNYSWLLSLAEQDAFSSSTSCSNLAFQFDLYVPNSWDSGYLVARIGSSSGGNFDFKWETWTASTIANKGVRKGFKNTSGWITVTAPLSSYNGLVGKNFKFCFDNMNATTNSKQYGIGFANKTINGFDPQKGKYVFYVDNFRFVPTNVPAVPK